MLPLTSTDRSRMEMAHILFMDVVGYSKLPTDVQQETIGELQAIVRATAAYQKAKEATN